MRERERESEVAMDFNFSKELAVRSKLGRRNSPDSVAVDLADAKMKKHLVGQHKLGGESSETSEGSLPRPPPHSPSHEEKDNTALFRGLHIGGMQSDEDNASPGTNKSAKVGTSDNVEAYYEVQRARPASFRRDSIEHNKRQSPTRLRDDMPGDTSSSSSSLPMPPTQIIVPIKIGKTATTRRRSSLKKTKPEDSFATSSNKPNSTSSAERKRVSFSSDVRMKKIERPDDEQIARAWLSKEERAEIQVQAKADLKIIKRISKEPDQSSPDIRAIRKTISLRGLEQFFSKRTLRDLKEELQDVIYGVLEAQELQRQVSEHLYGAYGPRQLAKLSAELSEPARERATRQGREDEAAVVSYLGRTSRAAAEPGFSFHPSRSSSSSGGNGRANRRGSMPTSTEMVNANTSYRSGLSSLGDSIRSAPGTNLDDSSLDRRKSG